MLGSLEVRAASGEVLEIGGARLRALLIMLALRPGQLVPASQLIDGLWADQAPAGAANALQALVSRLRRALPEALIESRPAGYQLKLDPGATDIVRFEELAAAGRAQLRDDPAAAAATLRRALGLWRGPALAEVAETEFGRAVIARLDELRCSPPRTASRRTCAAGGAGGAVVRPGPDRPTAPGTGCWRSSGPTARSGWPRRESATSCARRTRGTSPGWPRRARITCSAREQLDWLRRLADGPGQPARGDPRRGRGRRRRDRRATGRRARLVLVAAQHEGRGGRTDRRGDRPARRRRGGGHRTAGRGLRDGRAADRGNTAAPHHP